jgi:hypothetical protein
MNAEARDVATVEQSQPIAIREDAPFRMLGFTANSLKDALDVCKMIADSDLAGPQYKGKPANVLIAVQMGMEVGLAPMQALQSIAVIQGRPCIWGNGRRALVKAHPMHEYTHEEWDEKTKTAICTMKRRGEPPQTKTFSEADARAAGLLSKDTYKSYLKDMLAHRAHARCTDSVFPDAVKGLRHAEDVIDLPPDQYHEEPPRPVVRMPEAKAEPGAKVSAEQHRLLRARIRECAAGDKELEANLAAALKEKYGIEHSNDLLAADLNAALEWLADQVGLDTNGAPAD